MAGSGAFLMSFWMAYSAVLSSIAESELSPEIHAHELRAHVYRLASPEFLGRRGPGAARTARHLAAAFKRLGLKPAFGDSYYQDVPSLLHEGVGKADVIGRNVGALLPGRDSRLQEEWVLVSAHFDH